MVMAARRGAAAGASPAVILPVLPLVLEVAASRDNTDLLWLVEELVVELAVVVVVVVVAVVVLLPAPSSLMAVSLLDPVSMCLRFLVMSEGLEESEALPFFDDTRALARAA
jgi:hypothetical protein